VCVNRNRGRNCFLFSKGPILNDIRGHSGPKNICQLQEIASNFSKFSGGGPQTPRRRSRLWRSVRGFVPLPPPLSKIPGSAPALSLSLSASNRHTGPTKFVACVNPRPHCAWYRTSPHPYMDLCGAARILRTTAQEIRNSPLYSAPQPDETTWVHVILSSYVKPVDQ